MVTEAKVNIRQASRGDEAVIVAAIKELAASIGEQSPLTEQHVQEYLTHPGCGVLLAEVEGQVVGLISYSARPNLYHGGASGLIEKLWLHTEQRKGITAQMQRALNK